MLLDQSVRARKSGWLECGPSAALPEGSWELKAAFEQEYLRIRAEDPRQVGMCRPEALFAAARRSITTKSSQYTILDKSEFKDVTDGAAGERARPDTTRGQDRNRLAAACTSNEGTRIPTASSAPGLRPLRTGLAWVIGAARTPVGRTL